MTNSNHPLVSVIIITYNMGKYIELAIKSVLNQTFEDFELIVIDDGSDDNTKDIISKSKDRLIYQYSDNGGRAAARNRGLQLARGEYIAFLDADDIWFRKKLMWQVEYIRNNKSVDVLYSPVIFTDSNGKILHKKSRTALKYYKRDINGLTYENTVICSFTLMSTVLIKKNTFEDVGKFDEKFRVLEDLDWFLRALNKNKIIKLDNLTPLAYSRMHQDQHCFELVEPVYLYIYKREIRFYSNRIPDKKNTKKLSKLYLACSLIYRKIKRYDDAWLYFRKSLQSDRSILLTLTAFRNLVNFIYIFMKKVFTAW